MSTTTNAQVNADGSPRKQIIFAVGLIGVNEQTLWEHPDAGSQIDFSSFTHVAQAAERGRFDYFFLAEGLAMRSRGDRVFEHDIAGRPATLAVLAALAAVTEHIGLVGTLSTTFNEPYELARQVASLDHLSGGRAGWNVVTSFDDYTGGNFRRGGYLKRAQRYERAEEFVTAVQQLWDSWGGDAVVADKESGVFLADPDAGAFDIRSNQFDIAGRFNVPRSPQGRPVIVQAGVSPQGRQFAAANADAIFSPFIKLEEAQPYYRDVRERAVAAGRQPDDVKILPGVQYAIGDSESEARDLAQHILEQQLSDTAIYVRLEQVWNRDLSQYDLDGPVPDIGPEPEGEYIQGRTLISPDRAGTIRGWQELAREKSLTMRGLMHEIAQGPHFIGTPDQIATQMNDLVQQDGCDGFVLTPEVVPTGIDEFVDRVVPILQERGVLRTEYEGTTLRDNLGLSVPARAAARVAD